MHAAMMACHAVYRRGEAAKGRGRQKANMQIFY